MAENDEDALKMEIDEIMDRVKTIMDNVAKVMPQDEEGTGRTNENRSGA
ncbi:hypothetical protein [Desulfosarcina ovata]|uniref:Uncharacterized protein n=2 Tax=Desulfosarcina ovata TaxID=83564 RepID=A0A5K8ANA2_9BACT|nr:hypothetical protein [Desulfosarcina ovata]BBO86406.1 hypothetical protein DSCO28_69720 [Desulfosarcina ovata subsp. sediminis]BBO93350.1 hypothetical protein DSCOOX_65300 [Desulfosarcina ovata subsp. ovata]